MGTQLLGDHVIGYEPFEKLDTIFKEFHTPTFKKLPNRKKFKRVNQLLLELIQKTKTPCFLLPAALEYVDRINKEKVLHDHYRFSSFEFWLNKFSMVPEEENLKIRGKLVGQLIPREEYQTAFPIGMGKTFSGSHFVTAHFSPDVDTTIASFWGWMDAFGARVAENIHEWNLPGTFGDSHFTFLFHKLFSNAVFRSLARTVPALTLTAQDLVTQRDFIKLNEHSHISKLEYNHFDKAIILTDDEDLFKGDWRSSDAEAVRQIMVLFTSLIRTLENTIYSKLIATFAKKSIHLADVKKNIEPIFERSLKAIELIQDYSDKQKSNLNEYLVKVLGVSKGLQSTVLELGYALDRLSENKFSTFYDTLLAILAPTLYDSKKQLLEDRPAIFTQLEKIIHALTDFIVTLRERIEELSMMLQVKEKVLGRAIQYVTLKSDVEEIRSKIGNLDHITVVISEGEGKLFPVGVIHQRDLKRAILGTVSFRDFSNEQETQMASYLEVISVIDHHKASLKTVSAPCFIIADVQSSNTLVAELAFAMNERYSSLGLSKAVLQKQIETIQKKKATASDLKQLSRLMQLKSNSEEPKSGYFIHPQREYVQYLCCLYAILDDTDLLTKVSARDVEVVAKLLNRMKSITSGKDSEIVSLDSIPRNEEFAKQAALTILQNKDMYSFYKKIYEYKEEEVAANLKACVAEKPSNVFSDTKEQNGCCRVGQTKIFDINYPLFKKLTNDLRMLWLQSAQRAYAAKPQIDFHMHMISTVASADELYSGLLGKWKHQDEIWIWIPSAQQGMEHLISFLNAFASTPVVQKNQMSVELLGPNYLELKQAFEENFPQATIKYDTKSKTGLPIAILRFTAGILNSRKAQISPFLPKTVP